MIKFRKKSNNYLENSKKSDNFDTSNQIKLFAMGKVKEFEMPDFDTDVIEIEESKLVVFNDDTNTFEHVIDTLVDVCGHTPEQAEQCAWIIHSKGKYAVKEGEFESLAPMRNDICRRGISAEIM